MLALYQEIVAEGRWLLASPGEGPITLDLWRSRILDPRSVCRVAREGPRLLGWAHVSAGPMRRVAHVGHLEIFLAPGARGRGLGERLLAATLEGARVHPTIRKVGLSVRADNPRAIALYERVGFALEGRRKGEVRDGDALVDDLLMGMWVG